MRIDIITPFPEIIAAPLNTSILQRAQNKKLLTLTLHQLRDWADPPHYKIDDYLCGGGPGMLLKPEPLFRAVESLASKDSQVILMTPQGKPFKQGIATQLVQKTHLIILCGHYEGVDHRVVEQLVDLEISIGDYILTNGTLAAAVVTDSIVRLIPQVLGDERSIQEESFSNLHLLEAPAYTKPADFRTHQVPEILLSGDHKKITQWKTAQAIKRTQQNRPDLSERQ